MHVFLLKAYVVFFLNFDECTGTLHSHLILQSALQGSQSERSPLTSCEFTGMKAHALCLMGDCFLSDWNNAWGIWALLVSLVFRCSSRRGAGEGDEEDRRGAAERVLCAENTSLHAAALGKEDWTVCTSVTGGHAHLRS